MSFGKLFTCVLALLALAVSAGNAVAQTAQGQVLGKVIDPAGTVIQAARVTLTNELTGVTWEQETSASGDFVFPYLDSGRFSVTVQKDGFDTARVPGVRLEVGERKRVDVSLNLGQVRTVVEVNDVAAKVDTDSAAVASVVSERQVTDLPLYGRDFSRLAFLIPGTRPQGGRDSYTGGNFITQWGTTVNVGGGGWEKNQYSIDGVDNTMRGDGGPAANPSVDAIQEFRIDRSVPPADYGLGAAVIETVTKSGTNSYHGTAWEYLRNYKLNAGNYLTHKQDTIKRNEFGANAGGPIVKNRAFFFVNWESLRAPSNVQLLATVPTAKMRNGDLSEYPETPIDPQTGLAFENKRIPAERLSDVSLAYINSFMPLPNLPGVRLNYVANKRSTDSWNQFMGRFDYYTRASKDRFFLRFLENPRNGLRAGISAFTSQNEDQHFHNEGLGWIRTWNSKVITEARLGIHQERAIFTQGTFHDPQPRIKGFGERPVVPNGDLIAWSYQSFGDFGYPIAFQRKSANVSTNTTLFWGRHLLKVGFQMERQQYNFDMYPQFVSIAWFSNIYTGSAPGDLLMGFPYQAQDRMGFLNQNLRVQTYSPFIQDDWRVTANLTLNLGLRYDLGTVPYDANNVWGNFDAKLGKIVVAGDHVISQGVNPFLLNAWSPLIITADKAGLPKNTLAYGDHNNFGPRVGFAWRPFKDNKTVVRGAYGVLYLLNNQTYVNFSNFSAPYSQRMTLVNTRPAPSFTIDSPFTSPVTPSPLTYGMNPNRRTGYIQQTTFGVQRELPWGVVAEVLMQDQNSKKLEIAWDLNSAVQGSGSVNSRRPYYPAFGPGITYQDNQGTSRYDDLEFSLKKTGQHYSFWWSHVWSKEIGWGNGVSGTSYIVNPYAKGEFAGPLDYVPHLDKLSFLVDLPAGKGRRLLNYGGVADALLGGWSVAGYFTLYQSGSPLTIGWSGDSANVGIFGVRPNRICSGKLDNPTMSKWFDTSCFVAPTPGTFGNSGSGILTGPSTFGADFSLLKNFSILEKAKLQFRSEFFNVFNHPNLTNPQTGANSANFGQILTKSLDPRVIQFGLRLSF